jgi:hypothetical protein
MFAVFAEGAHEVCDFTGRGDTPQVAWENMLRNFSIDESDIDMDSVVFYRQTEVFQETKVFWSTVSDTDEE